MPTVKANYEAVFIFSLTLGEEGIAAIMEKFKSLIEQNAEIGEVDEWGKRRLAYPINDENDGHYVLYNFTSGPEFPAELDRVSKITSGVLRSMIIRKEEPVSYTHLFSAGCRPVVRSASSGDDAVGGFTEKRAVLRQSPQRLLAADVRACLLYTSRCV